MSLSCVIEIDYYHKKSFDEYLAQAWSTISSTQKIIVICKAKRVIISEEV